MAFASDILFSIDTALQQKGSVNIETITGDKALGYDDSSYQVITNSKGSNADVRMPAKKDGVYFWIKNADSSAHALLIQESDTTPIIGGSGLAAGKAALVVCDGSNWAVVFEQA
tara:strand:+ start:35 stop:376 length:342 start_codon:yes stop_codon:yes gene_type:complete